MRPLTFSRLTISLLLAVTATGQALAALPGPPHTEHPYLFASSADIAALKARVMPFNFSETSGTISLAFTPALSSDKDGQDVMLLGTQVDAPTKKTHFSMRYIDQGSTSSAIKFQLGFVVQNADGTTRRDYLPVITLPAAPTTITLQYDNNARTITLSGPVQHVWKGFEWNPNNQSFYFAGHKNQTISNLSINGTTVDLDWDLTSAYQGLLEIEGPKLAQIVSACQNTSIPVADISDVCNVAAAGRNVITETAKRLALGYRLADSRLVDREVYVTAAVRYADLILSLRDNPQFGLGAYGEWSMNARVAALGVIYDHFNDRLDSTRKASMQDFIVKTIATARPAKDDLIEAVCGTKGLGDFPLDCLGTPDLEPYYITGHQASAMTGVAIGLLAIANERPEVLPLLGRIYTHLVDGILPARAYISRDGGHQTMFAYNNAGEVMERLVMWRRALNTGEQQILQNDFAPKLINPYIYALRAPGTYPATGDNYDMAVADPWMGYMAMAAAIEGNGAATAFYEEQIKPRRFRYSQQNLWDALYFSGVRAARVPLDSLPLSDQYPVSGSVIMRDTWNYADATLLDFKSSSFSSENHQHLDQNHFSLFYRAPLLVDSGAYDDYNSTHWFNYYRRTIAHNSIVLYDANETFSGYSNDGGQWVRGAAYPTLAQIQAPGGSNLLDGIETYEEGGNYAYVSANAGKAYKGGKLDPDQGFRRRIVYLRSTDKNPLILIHDRIFSVNAAPATSLLHSVPQPVTYAKQTPDPAVPGRYKIAGNVPIVIRNGDGMVTVEPLLPLQASTNLVGGIGLATCAQVVDKGETEKPDDCRFLVRTRYVDSNQQVATAWKNFPPKSKLNKKDVSDVGAWRIEISPVPENAVASHYQFFLNVLRVADNDRGNSAPVANTSRLLSSSDASADAVDVDNNTTVVFARNFRNVTQLRWKPNNSSANVLIVGMLPSTAYSKTRDLATGEWIISRVASPGLNLQSSANGVIKDFAN